MHKIQMLMTISILILLSTVILRINNTFFNTGPVLTNNKYGVLGVSLASSVIDEASNKAFDQVTDTSNIIVLANLTHAGSLGPDSGEVYPNFNDFDDYNGLVFSDSTIPSAVFNISTTVNYVRPSVIQKDSISLTRQWDKKITVTVSSPAMTDTIRMSSINSYWYFR